MVTASSFPYKSISHASLFSLNPHPECYKSRERENSISQSSPVVGKDTARYTAYTVKRKSEFFLFTE